MRLASGRWVWLLSLLAGTAAVGQQKPGGTIGSVAMQDATVAGSLEVTGGRAMLVGAGSVTARDHAAKISLARGGSVLVCQTSALKLSVGAAGAGTEGGLPLLLALDRGAIEVRGELAPGDVILTPDLRFTLSSKGLVDLRLRVAQNGDTCVEQTWAAGATLKIQDSFSEATYEIRGGQHVLFEHGSLREVVDHESSPCGCPAATMSVAEAALAAPGGDAAAAHPFPAAESSGLAPTAELAPQAPAGAVHTQVAASLSYEAPAAADPAVPEATAAPVAAPSVVAPAAAKAHGFGHALGRFFRRLFGGG